MLGALARKLPKVCVGVSGVFLGWVATESLGKPSMCSSESFAARTYRKSEPKEWTSTAYVGMPHMEVMKSMRCESKSVVVLDPTGEDLVASVQVACAHDARRLVYLGLGVDVTKKLCSELCIEDIKDLKHLDGKLLIVVETDTIKNYYKHVHDLIDATKRMDVLVVILTRDPLVAKLCQKNGSLLVYDKSNEMLSQTYAEHKLRGVDDHELKNLVMACNSPSFAEYVGRTYLHTTTTQREVMKLGARSMTTMYANMHEALATNSTTK